MLWDSLIFAARSKRNKELFSGELAQKTNKSAGRDLKKDIFRENGIMTRYIRGPLVESKKTKKSPPPPSDALPGASLGGYAN